MVRMEIQVYYIAIIRSCYNDARCIFRDILQQFGASRVGESAPNACDLDGQRAEKLYIKFSSLSLSFSPLINLGIFARVNIADIFRIARQPAESANKEMASHAFRRFGCTNTHSLFTSNVRLSRIYSVKFSII